MEEFELVHSPISEERQLVEEGEQQRRREGGSESDEGRKTFPSAHLT